MTTQLSLKTQKASVILPLHILEQRCDHPESMKLLIKNGLRPLTYQEALSRSSELINKLQDKWFYLDGKVISNDNNYTFNSKGELAELTGSESADQIVCVLSGNQPLSLDVNSDDHARKSGKRFFLDGVSHGAIARVVVGVPDPEAMAKAIVAEGSAALQRLKRNSRE